jgi:hypothetical protein
MKEIKMDEIFEKMNTELNEMAPIGFFDQYILYVYSREGSVAHFHLLKGNPDSPSWQTCIRLETPEYFHHSGKEGTLNPKQKKHLVDFFNTANQDLPQITNWQSTVVAWNQNNPRWRIDRNTPMTDYLLLPQK